MGMSVEKHLGIRLLAWLVVFDRDRNTNVASPLRHVTQITPTGKASPMFLQRFLQLQLIQCGMWRKQSLWETYFNSSLETVWSWEGNTNRVLNARHFRAGRHKASISSRNLRFNFSGGLIKSPKIYQNPPIIRDSKKQDQHLTVQRLNWCRHVRSFENHLKSA